MNKETKTALNLAIEALEFEGGIKEALKACKEALKKQNKPLDSGEIKHIFLRRTGFFMDDSLILFVRDIEQAHGIFENTLKVD
jgi:hypothetical protein